MVKRRHVEQLVGAAVRVVWHDAVGLTEGWSTVDELINAELPKCETVSFLVHVSETALHLASTRSADGVAGTSLIPLAWVSEATRVAENS